MAQNEFSCTIESEREMTGEGTAWWQAATEASRAKDMLRKGEMDAEERCDLLDIKIMAEPAKPGEEINNARIVPCSPMGRQSPAWWRLWPPPSGKNPSGGTDYFGDFSTKKLFDIFSTKDPLDSSNK